MKPSNVKDQEHLETMKSKSIKGEFKLLDNSYHLQKWLRKIKTIRRMGPVHIIKEYKLSVHCYYTGMLFQDVAKLNKISITSKEIYWVFRHDLLEVLTGDLLYPAKHTNDITSDAWSLIEETIVKDYPEFAAFTDTHAKNEIFHTEQSYTLFKACDLFELWLFCREEMKLGNKDEQVLEIVYNCQRWIPSIADKCKATYIIGRIESEWI